MKHYTTLGISSTATQHEIRQAYKSLAKMHHPDKGGEKNVFSSINEAYQILKNPETRAKYDQVSKPISSDTQFEDIFSQFFGSDPRQRNADVRLQVVITLEDVANGKDITVSYAMRSNNIATANIKIHAGVLHGEVLKFRGLGDNHYAQQTPGNLLVHVKVVDHPIFKRDGIHLVTTINLKMFDLILGTVVNIDQLTSGVLRVNIPKSTQADTILNIAGYGLLDPRSGKFGNLYVKIKCITPIITDNDLLTRIQSINDDINKIA